MSEWQQGLLSGIFAIIIVFTIDSLASWPYVIQALIAVTMGVLATMVCNKVFDRRRKHKENAR
ncbi:hypothetical protein CHL76_12080 [Marinococcus halophilus]|uniref:Uncharacterized protein n=1 Tax=Marinococcus halophilus TaxID=1371 RepID=A0A510Y7S9_MARHA|nr:hypothetical protein [Marinococcus halophilus]OZT79643.1 hypothetical protein CHL76_12080 [Marinococcus halophilus]GEK59415.1 hypothetical protein MHA01_23200 [Marinococcus halophilus]